LARIEIEGLSRLFGPLAALDEITLAIEPGEWVAVTGPSGSGKTTLLNILSGLDRPTAGRVRVGGTDLAQLGARELARYRQQTVGLVFQQFHLIPYLTALENVMLAQYVHSMTDRDEAIAALRRVGLGERLQHLPSQLSGGEQQRVCIARALINQPPLILADEPTGNLDAINEAVVMTLLSDLHRRGHTLVLVTHDPSIAARATREVRLEHGRLAAWREAESGPTSEEMLPVLVELWRKLEEDGEAVSVSQRKVADLLAQGLLAFAGSRIELTPRGRELAAAAVRRVRLAEALLARTLAPGSVSDECGRATPVAAGFEDQVCAFLAHPDRCPHGRLIAPLGPSCCAEQAAAAARTEARETAATEAATETRATPGTRAASAKQVEG
jgi:putative ABC transport system ATP-binding protein